VTALLAMDWLSYAVLTRKLDCCNSLLSVRIPVRHEPFSVLIGWLLSAPGVISCGKNNDEFVQLFVPKDVKVIKKMEAIDGNK
jgi:hypothetical protein